MTTIRGADCVEISTGEPMTFALPPEPPANPSLDQAADLLLDHIETHGHSPELAEYADRLAQVPVSAEVRLAEQDAQIAAMGAAVKDAARFADDGDYELAAARLAAIDTTTFTAQREITSIEDVSRMIDADREAARAAEQAAADAEASRLTLQHRPLLDEYDSPRPRPRHPGKP